MSIRKGHATVVYRKENGVHIVYSQSLISACYIPLFVKFTYIYPQMLVIGEGDNLQGTIPPSRFIFPSTAEHLVEKGKYLQRVVAGYDLPFLDKEFSVPTLVGMGLFSTRIRFIQTKTGMYRVKAIAHNVDFTPIYTRFHLVDKMVSFFSKYYNCSTLYPLITGQLLDTGYLNGEPKLLRGGSH